jgi:hypothetical protein
MRQKEPIHPDPNSQSYEEDHYAQRAITHLLSGIGRLSRRPHLLGFALALAIAMFAAIRRVSSRLSGFVCSFEHLAARLKNRHHGWWTENTSNLTVSVFRAARRCASPEPFPESARFQSCALTTARHVGSYLRKAWDGQSGARALAFKMALCSATLQVNPAAWPCSPRCAALHWA